jgi:hypothetical protein
MRITKKNHNLLILITLGFVSELLYMAIYVTGNIGLNIRIFLLIYACLFILYWTAFSRFARGSGTRKEEDKGISGNWLRSFSSQPVVAAQLKNSEIVTIAVLFGIIFRLTLLLSQPGLSEDVYRYVWDARVSENGINPYRYAPDAGELSHLQDEKIYPNINHKEIPTIYPPVLQAVFSAAHSIRPTIQGIKSVFVFFDLCTALVLFLIIRCLGLNASLLLIYLWNPLLIVEVAGSGHAEPVGIFFLMLSLLLVLKGYIRISTILLSFSFLTKFLSLLFLPVFIYMRRAGKGTLIGIFVTVTVLLYLPFIDAGANLFSALRIYSEKWQFNGSVFSVLKWLFEILLPDWAVTAIMIWPFNMGSDVLTIATRRTDLALHLSKLIIAVFILWQYRMYLTRYKKDFQAGNIRIFRFGLLFIGMVIILGPTVHPWYLCWLIPFLTLVPNSAGIWLTGLIILSYWILVDYTATGIWRETVWIRMLEYIPFYAMLFKQRLRDAGFKKGMFLTAHN